jgi:Nuclease-related domain
MISGGVRVIPCGRFANESERLAVERLKGKLQGSPGPWILLTNLNYSSQPSMLSDEIDIVAVGPPGVFVIEVKHWDAPFLKQRQHNAEVEADRVNAKAKRVAGD